MFLCLMKLIRESNKSGETVRMPLASCCAHVNAVGNMPFWHFLLLLCDRPSRAYFRKQTAVHDGSSCRASAMGRGAAFI